MSVLILFLCCLCNKTVTQPVQKCTVGVYYEALFYLKVNDQYRYTLLFLFTSRQKRNDENKKKKGNVFANTFIFMDKSFVFWSLWVCNTLWVRSLRFHMKCYVCSCKASGLWQGKLCHRSVHGRYEHWWWKMYSLEFHKVVLRDTLKK